MTKIIVKKIARWDLRSVTVLLTSVFETNKKRIHVGFLKNYIRCEGKQLKSKISIHNEARQNSVGAF